MSPWPRDGFGLERMRALLAELGNPQDAYPAIHVVGTNGKSTATVTIEQLLLSEGLAVGSTISPHVATLERADPRERRRGRLRSCGRASPQAGGASSTATQFEIVTAAALTAFADARRRRRRGRGGTRWPVRRDERPAHRVVLLTNVGLEHTDVLGDTLEAIATEKLAVAPDEAIVVLPDDTYAHLVPGREIRHRRRTRGGRGIRRPRDRATPDVLLPGRFERREGEVRDGAHNPDGARHLVEQLDRDDYTVVASILGDKDVDAMLRDACSRGSSVRRHDLLVGPRSRRGRSRRARRPALRPRGGRRRPGRGGRPCPRAR